MGVESGYVDQDRYGQNGSAATQCTEADADQNGEGNG
jgi:hypothetical protein